ncbi:MAG: RNA polymerase sigma factor [Lachnospiraceae bacterium]
MNLDEEVLVRQMKEGDKASFDLLYDKYKNVALRTAYLITGNLPDSEDVVQDTFVKVYLHCKELKNDSGFKAWMMQILVRTAYKTGKKKGRELPDEEVIDKADTRTERSSLEQVLVKEESRMLSEAIHRLPIKQRTVVILFYYQEYSVSEIARMLGSREGTVKSRLHVARERLRVMLEKDSDTAAYMHDRILE